MSQKNPTTQVLKVKRSSDLPHSKFKVKHLLDLNNQARSYNSPLAVIGHIDMNAFFAQVEQLRLGLSVDDAVVAVQWSSIIAVSYKAREYGISRLDTLESAKLKCPILKPIHTAVFKRGENFWRYHDDDKEFPSPKEYKVSLDPYRRESRKILKIFKNNVDLVEKASVDESFMDLGRCVLKKLFELLPNMHEDILKLDKDDYLPLVPDDFELEVHGEVVQGDLEENTDQLYINDWDDVLILLGSIKAYDIRLQVVKELGYTTSCGVGRVKTIAKLASGFKKPDNQTIIRNSAINNFLKNFDFTDFWSMGGKTGEFIKQKLSPPLEDSIKFIRENYDLQELEDYLEDKSLAEKLYKMIRGEYYTPLSERVVLKSMNSNKNIRGESVRKLEDCMGWIRVFAADLYQRLVETDDENGNRTRPKTVSIFFRSYKDYNFPHSKQSTLPIVPKEDMEETLYKYGVNLLKMLEAQFGNIYPLQNVSMTISNFETMDNVPSSILNFAKKGNVNDLFAKQIEEKQKKERELDEKKLKQLESDANNPEKPDTKDSSSEPEILGEYTLLDNGNLKCPKCEAEVPDRAEHDDFHYAIELTEALNGSENLSDNLQKFSNTKSYGEMRLNSRSPAVGSSNNSKKRSTGKKSNGKADKKLKTDKSQSRLPF